MFLGQADLLQPQSSEISVVSKYYLVYIKFVRNCYEKKKRVGTKKDSNGKPVKMEYREEKIRKQITEQRNWNAP